MSCFGKLGTKVIGNEMRLVWSIAVLWAGGHKMVVYGGEAGVALDDMEDDVFDDVPDEEDEEHGLEEGSPKHAPAVYILDIDNLHWSRMETSCPQECPGLRALHLTTVQSLGLLKLALSARSTGISSAMWNGFSTEEDARKHVMSASPPIWVDQKDEQFHLWQFIDPD